MPCMARGPQTPEEKAGGEGDEPAVKMLRMLFPNLAYLRLSVRMRAGTTGAPRSSQLRKWPFQISS